MNSKYLSNNKRKTERVVGDFTKDFYYLSKNTKGQGIDLGNLKDLCPFMSVWKDKSMCSGKKCSHNCGPAEYVVEDFLRYHGKTRKRIFYHYYLCSKCAFNIHFNGVYINKINKNF